MKTQKKKSFLSRIVLFFNFLAILMLLMVYLGVRVSPDIFWPIAFPGLVYPIIFLINLFFVGLWLLKMKWYFILSLLTILLGWEHVVSFVQYNNTSKKLPESGTNISVLSYNVRVFDMYNYGPNWEHNYSMRNNIFKFLQEKDFDIICIQEFVHDTGGSFKTLDTLPSIIRARHSHTGFSQSSKNVNFFGLATFSANPIIHKGKIAFPSQMGNLCIYSDIKIGSDTIRVYNVHFESIGLSSEDYVFVESFTNSDRITDREYFKQGSIRILKRIKNAFSQRVVQIKMVTDHVKHCPYPVILAGDFNDTPASWAYRQLTTNLDDAFKSGKGIGQTYIGSIPGFRIDYVLHSNDFKAYNFQTGNHRFSDHYPVWVWLNLNKE